MSRRHAALVIALIAVVVGLGLQRVDDNGPHQKAIVRASAAAGAAISVDGRPARSIPDLVWFAINWLKKFPMHFGPRLGERRVKAGGLRGMPRAGLNARNLLRAGTEGHSRAMATTSNDAFGQKGAEIIQ